MADIIRDSAFGQIVRYVTKGKYFQYPEERDSFPAHEYFSNNTTAGSVEKENEGEASSGATTPRRAPTEYAATVAPTSIFGAEMVHSHPHSKFSFLLWLFE